VSVHVRYSGPLFSRSRIADAMRKIDDDAEKDLADAVEAQVHANLRKSLKNPTGYYQSRITKERSGAGWKVHDGGVVYRCWLEGVGSRNQTTRFKGYASFRRAKQTVEARANGIGDRAVKRHIRKLGG
jgi:hypothetical protein